MSAKRLSGKRKLSAVEPENVNHHPAIATRRTRSSSVADSSTFQRSTRSASKNAFFQLPQNYRYGSTTFAQGKIMIRFNKIRLFWLYGYFAQTCLIKYIVFYCIFFMYELFCFMSFITQNGCTCLLSIRATTTDGLIGLLGHKMVNSAAPLYQDSIQGFSTFWSPAWHSY